MSNLCNFFDVSGTSAIPNGFIVERCSDYSDAYGDAVIYCREERKADILAWIEDNVKVNVDSVKNMFINNPSVCINYLKQVAGDDYYTEMFVDECGGSQEFLDIYCKSVAEEPEVDTVEEPEEPVVEEPVVEEPVVEELTSEPEVEPVIELTPEPEVVPEPVVEEPEEPVVESAVEEPEEPVVEQAVESPEPVVESPEPAPVQHAVETAPPVQQAVETAPPVQQVVPASQHQGVTAEEVNSIVANLLEQTMDNRNEVILLRTQAEQMLRDAERKTLVLEQNYGTISRYFTPEGEFVGFNDENRYIETLAALKDLDKRVCMASIDPDEVLNKVQLSKAIDFLGNYAPEVFKMFFQKLVTDADSERDRLRVTALLNDFAVFVEEGCKTW